MLVAWCLASPKIGERQAAAGLLAHAARTGTLVATRYGVSLVRSDRRGEAPRHGSPGWIGQWIESVNDTLKGHLDFERHGGRTIEGVYARITQRLRAMAVRSGTAGRPAPRPSAHKESLI